MPINELEIHPFLHLGESISSVKMIIGTFPIYSLTNPRTPRKSQLQQERNDVSFFYGSRSNYLWSWYQQYVDNQVNIQLPSFIIASLGHHHIGVSDVIRQCTRKDESFRDSDFSNIEWNYGLAAIIEQRINKIICTSKSEKGAMGWLRDKILLPAGFVLDQEQGFQMHQQILGMIDQSNQGVKSIAQVLKKGNSIVHILSIPSPGSPNRRLIDFGYREGIHTTPAYLNQYLTSSFNWFMQ